MDFNIKTFEEKIRGDRFEPGQGTGGAKLYLERAMEILDRKRDSGATVKDSLDGHDHLQLMYDEAIDMIRLLDRKNGDPAVLESEEFKTAQKEFESAANWAGFHD